jgi:hypothetical protein
MGIRRVEQRLDCLREIPVPDVVNDADDGEPGRVVLRRRQLDALPEGSWSLKNRCASVRLMTAAPAVPGWSRASR